MPQIYDMGPTALLPLRRKVCWGFFRPKNPTASAGFEPANLGTKGQHATPRPPKPTHDIFISHRKCSNLAVCHYVAKTRMAEIQRPTQRPSHTNEVQGQFLSNCHRLVPNKTFRFCWSFFLNLLVRLWSFLFLCALTHCFWFLNICLQTKFSYKQNCR